ncbi:YhgE/Pip domain-containing protein [Adlercreutzia sp. ZJ154]|uniref:YhgE/Pip domain-containing protein n=1 Tax=Adlercreutzia sp. ZJ154 TaxID=2709790 RepID=UPI0013EA3F27|nr:YhgE/Pip domain-containing protein [Adlercreutzia sp. ZJ154]
MGNVFRVLKRDILRLLKVPPAMVVIIALLVLPSLYTWYNVRGFWDPYENTGDLRVCVVNEDAGADSELTGYVDVGQMIVDELHNNRQLDWQFPSYDNAMDQLYSGECYAVFVIPEEFSADLLTLTTGDFKQPNIKYYVNEKIGPVSPKITDTGANTLDNTVNSAFVETVSKKAADAIDAAIDDSRDKVDAARLTASARISEAEAHIQDAISAVSELSSGAQQAKTNVDKAKAPLDTARNEINHASDALQAISDLATTLQGDYLKFSASSVPAISSAMQSAADAYAEAVIALEEIPVQSPEIQDIIRRLRASADKVQSDAAKYSDVLANEIAPAFGAGLGEIAGASGQASGSVAAQKVLIAQADNILANMDSTLESVVDALAQTQTLLSDLASNLDRVQTDVLALTSADAITSILGEQTLDAQKVAEFIGAPTQLTTEKLYPVNAYGTAMAPLFMNLTFWIGAFMLMVVLRQEVDDKGIKNLTLTQRYLGRYLLFAIMVILQAVICCAGLPHLGVEIANLPALFFAAAVASLAYLSIIYSLSVTLQHIGKGICIILVFAQIPGATGLYPIEMTSPFFQAIYPLLPFTYGISAMRESICGFYGSQYAVDIGILMLYLAVFMTIGILVRPLMSNVNRMVARQIKESGIFNGEDVEVPVRRYRVSQVIRILSDRKEFREDINRRYARFKKAYPWLIRGAIIAGVAIPVVLTVIFSFGTTGKVMLLTLWLVCLIAVFIFLVVVESLKSSFERQVRIDNMSDEEVRNLYLARNATEYAGVVHGQKRSKRDAVVSGGDGDE